MTTLLLAKHDNRALNDATAKSLTAALAIGAPTTPVTIAAVVITSLGDHVRKRQCSIHSNTALQFNFLCIDELSSHFELHSTSSAW